MNKRGNAYLRTLLIHGARSAILAAKNKVDNTNGWLTNLLQRRHPNIAAGGTGQQERAHRVGDARPWARI
jgi:transposase